MTMLVVLVLITVALGLAAARGHTYDSRDPEYSLGLVPVPYQHDTDALSVTRPLGDTPADTPARDRPAR